MPQTRPIFEQIDSWLKEIDTVKTATASPAKPAKPATKKAAPAGMGESSHPSDDVDDNTQKAETGERYSENSTDVKKDVPGQAVDETDKNSGGDQDDKQFNIGTNQSAVGEDPSVEDDYKGDKDDPGTSHPADAESTGEKYSSVSLDKLLKMAEARANDVLADLANGIGTGNGAPVATKKATTQDTTKTPVVSKTAAPVAPAPVAQVPDATQLTKQASEYVAHIIKDAELDADLVGSYLHSYSATRNKVAGDGSETADEDVEKGPSEAPPEGGAGASAPPPDVGAGGPVMPPEAGGGGGDILSALGAGGAGGPPPGAGGDPSGGMPPPGAGGDPSGGAGGVSQDQALQELAMALQELGIDPAQLAQVAQGQGAKMASAVTSFKLAGKFRFEEAKTAQQRKYREDIKDYLLELTGNKR